MTLPLYPSEAEIAKAVLGSKAKEWRALAKYLEDKHGLPRIDTLMGGRFWPAVEEYFRNRHGLGTLSHLSASASSRIRVVPFAPDGKDNFSRDE